MVNAEYTAEQISEWNMIVKNAVSIELRVSNAEVENTVRMMDKQGFKSKGSWASMELSDHTVINFWKKELIKYTNA
ncbi:hypothetical protein [Paenibacillus sp. LHD-38]|uniref:hypothetical protein n=1 Tax=Paenibacillus sp. LHD-38 TaxID=3072143 RepID=UPI00280FA86D|nr:hypothetical protein [Paenibacillus sp. LHD-38]MDQ8735251.1 hypothetical protein [Paenibacillus sp. LHD-38]